MSLAPTTRPWPGALAPLWWAGRALWRETLGFRFAYPVEARAAAAGEGSLHYHVVSDRLFFDAMDLDASGIPRHRTRLAGATSNPAYVAWYGLMSLERRLGGVDGHGADTFLAQAEWLRARAVRRADACVVWPLDFDCREGRCFLKAPWISAMVQGLAMSALVRAYRLTGDREWLALSLGAAGVFDKAIEDGGVRTLEAGYALYEEYPAHPLPRVLDGFVFGLLGLYDVAVTTGDARARQLFQDGVEGLGHALPSWDYRSRWSWYGTHGYLCPPPYHNLNVALLRALERASGDGRPGRYARAWDPTRLPAAARVEVLAVFLVTKNRCRLRHVGSRR